MEVIAVREGFDGRSRRHKGETFEWPGLDEKAITKTSWVQKPGAEDKKAAKELAATGQAPVGTAISEMTPQQLKAKATADKKAETERKKAEAQALKDSNKKAIEGAGKEADAKGAKGGTADQDVI